MKVAFVVPPKSKHGFVEAEDCCFRAARKRHLPAMLLACASQIENAMFLDLSIDKPRALNAAKPDVVVYPTIWNHYDWIMASMDKLAPGARKIILPVPPGYAESHVGASPPLSAKPPPVFCAVYSEPETVFADFPRSKGDLIDWRNSAKGLAWSDEKGGHVSGYLPTCLHQIKGTDFGLVSSRYWRHYQTAIYQVTRGCPYRCTFCVWGGSTVTDRTFRIRPARQVARDLWQMRSLANRAKGLRKGYPKPIPLYLLSAQLTTSLKWLRRFASMMEGNPYPYQSNVNLKDITEEKMNLLIKAGMISASAGLEALSDEMLTRMRKGHTFDQAIEGALILERSGIPYSLHVRTRYGETAEDVREGRVNLRRMYDAGVRHARVHFGPLAHFRGTILQEEPPYPVAIDNRPHRRGMSIEWAVRDPDATREWQKIGNLAKKLFNPRRK